MLPKLSVKTFSDFWNARGGVVAVIFAIVIVPFIGVVALAIDYDRALNAKTRVQAALDISSLAGAKALIESQSSAAEAARKMLSSYREEWQNYSVSTAITTTDTTVRTTANVTIATTFGRVLGIDSISYDIFAVATSAHLPVDVHIAVDLSGSMGLAATAADRERLMAVTKPFMRSWFARDNPEGCAFACHQQSPDVQTSPEGKTLYEVARENGIKIREDYVISSVDTLVKSLFVGRGERDIRVSLYAFSETAKLLVAPNGDTFQAADAFAAFSKADRKRTHFDEALPWIAKDASSRSSGRRKIMVLVTDGLYDKHGVEVRALKQQVCADIKSGGFELHVVEIKYENLSGDVQFDTWVGQNVYSQITPTLQSCPSLGQFYSASDPDQIATAMNEVTKSIHNTNVRLVR